MQKIAVGFLVAVALAALADLVLWCLHHDIVAGRPVLSLLIYALFLGLPLFHLLMAFYLTLRFRPRASPPAPESLRVDVFVTALDEPDWLVEKSLQAAVAMSYPHRTYLLDDGNNEAFRRIAEKVRAGYIARNGNRHFKAGNVNHALRQTEGEIVVIFDVDHVPAPGFLDRTVGFFHDPAVGFVQVMLTFFNQDESLLAQASAQTAFDFYNITLVGKDRCGAASLIGSNALIRRRALEVAGLYRPGLAEDLETSLALHGAGWKSVYVREALAPGLAPGDLMAFFKQQLKWARGVFEAALGSLRGTFFRLTPHQQLCYLTRFTYYLLGVLLPLNMTVVAGALVWPYLDIEEIAFKLLVLSVAAWMVKVCSLRLWALEPAARRGVLLKGSSLFAVTWPAYVLAALSTLFRRPPRFVATPKTISPRLRAWMFLPQLMMIALLALALLWRLMHWDAAPRPVTAGLAAFLVASQWILFVALFQSLRQTRKTADETSPSPVELFGREARAR